MIFRILLLTVILIVSGLPDALARNDERQEIQRRLAAEEENKAALESQVKDAEKKLQTIKKDLVKITAETRSHEQAIGVLEARIAQAVTEERALEQKLEQEYGSMATMFLAMERIRRVPPEALIVRPGAPLQAAQAALLLQNILPALNVRAQSLAKDLKRLAALRDTLEHDKIKRQEEKKALDEKYASIEKKAKERAVLYKNLNRDYKEAQDQVARIAQEARTMDELLSGLENESAKSASAGKWTMPKPGKPELPVPGVILTGFGEKDHIGAKSEGVTVESSAGAMVSAPMGGIVRFAGTFNKYGNMVILEHEKGYHSLLAGMDNVTVAVGQSVNAGEPLGKLPGASSRGGPPTLYYELRYKGKAVNPAKKFPSLKS